MSLIARVWFGKLLGSKLHDYLPYVCETGIKALRRTEGNRGALLMHRTEEDKAEIGVISFWESPHAIERFAGYNINKAVYFPKDAEYLLAMDPNLVHFEIPVAEGVRFESNKASTDFEFVHESDVAPETLYPGVQLRRLWKGANGSRALMVHMDPGSAWPQPDVHGSGPEEVYVVSGVFQDEQREYPAGSFIHHPAGSSHTPRSATGCVLFVFYPGA